LFVRKGLVAGDLVDLTDEVDPGQYSISNRKDMEVSPVIDWLG
jgi:hypothetical protein